MTMTINTTAPVNVQPQKTQPKKSHVLRNMCYTGLGLSTAAGVAGAFYDVKICGVPFKFKNFLNLESCAFAGFCTTALFAAIPIAIVALVKLCNKACEENKNK